MTLGCCVSHHPIHSVLDLGLTLTMLTSQSFINSVDDAVKQIHIG